ncbi:TIGR02466 family protein [Oxalobacteraceae bacterium A2-2]
MENQELQVHKLFSTPVLVTRLDEAPTINDALLAHFLPLARQRHGRRHSNLGGWQSDDDFHTLALPAAQALCRAVTRVVNSATALQTPGGLAPAALAWRVNAWVNVNPPGASNALHGHPGAYWSAVYYADDGGAGPDDGGALVFQDPRGVLPAMHDPLLRFRVEGCLSAGGIESIRPQPGMLVLFPAWLLHAVDPFHGPRPRVSVAFNFGTPGGPAG